MDAFRQLVDKHTSYAYTIASRIVGTPEAAEEVVQDAFVKLYRSAEGFKGDAKFTTWFYRVVFNTAVSAGRKNRIKTTELEGHEGYGERDYQDELQTDDRTQFLQQALQQLPDDDKMILTLFYFEELSLEEIAEVVGQEKNNLKVKLFRARKKLAVELNKMLKGEAASLL